jgi:hypothetical protein
MSVLVMNKLLINSSASCLAQSGDMDIHDNRKVRVCLLRESADNCMELTIRTQELGYHTFLPLRRIVGTLPF